jgi:RHS repeat-associated protein
VTCYTYDVLHRVISVTYPSGPNSSGTAKKYFVYDNATVNGVTMVNAKSRLAEAYTCTTCPGTKITDLGYSYAARGEVSDAYESTAHSSGYYHLTASYFANGVLNALSGVPGLPTIYYGGNNDTSGLDGKGRYLKVTASTGTNPVTGVTYTNSGTTQPIGSLTQVTLGSADNDTFSYDRNTGRLVQYKFNIGATPQTVQGNLTWNANGTLATLAITDPFNSANAQTCNYSHDDLARVASVNCGAPWSQTFTPDPFGNVTKSGSITFTPGFDRTKNWFLPVTGFDNNGNLLNDVNHSYSWDAENKLTAIDTLGLTFDALGRMVEQANGSSYTQILYAPTGGKLALTNGQSLTKAFVALPGGGAAVYGSSGTIAYYRHADWLGGSRFASTPARAMYYDVAYAPYGEKYSPSGTQDLNFTGQNQDTASYLYDFLYREYNPNSSRWIQPDPAGIKAANPGNPQTWNRYAYVANNPLSVVDPVGLLKSDATGSYQNTCQGSGDVGCPSYFQTQLDASNGNPDFSFEGYSDWSDRQTFGSNYYNLPGHGNTIQQELERHESIITTGKDPVLGIDRGSVGIEWSTSATSVEEAQKRAVTQALLALVCSADMTVACAETVYADLAPNKNVGDNGLKGGNFNFLIGGLLVDLSSCAGARCSLFGSLHFNSASNPTSVHLDTANPYIFPVGTLVHLVADYMLGHTVWASGIPR